eukprot:TRINITY_DN4179_c0_g1_i2.p1 TRINITY_DN4179_c0_g1~~TRINITY_DN4179_c0_g1_i2.p1  ORF type:complete len:305 (-),score=22.60 TRINITY_DN4179_c0_g1_i2:1029-1943(-)
MEVFNNPSITHNRFFLKSMDALLVEQTKPFTDDRFSRKPLIDPAHYFERPEAERIINRGIETLSDVGSGKFFGYVIGFEGIGKSTIMREVLRGRENVFTVDLSGKTCFEQFPFLFDQKKIELFKDEFQKSCWAKSAFIECQRYCVRILQHILSKVKGHSIVLVEHGDCEYQLFRSGEFQYIKNALVIFTLSAIAKRDYKFIFDKNDHALDMTIKPEKTHFASLEEARIFLSDVLVNLPHHTHDMADSKLMKLTEIFYEGYDMYCGDKVDHVINTSKYISMGECLLTSNAKFSPNISRDHFCKGR